MRVAEECEKRVLTFAGYVELNLYAGAASEAGDGLSDGDRQRVALLSLALLSGVASTWGCVELRELVRQQAEEWGTQVEVEEARGHASDEQSTGEGEHNVPAHTASSLWFC